MPRWRRCSRTWLTGPWPTCPLAHSPRRPPGWPAPPSHNLLRAAGSLASLPCAKARAATLRRDLIGVAARTTLPLCRLRYAGSATSWGFAIYRASHDDYDKSVLPSGYPAGTPQEALDCACGLYLGDTTAWLDPPPPTN